MARVDWMWARVRRPGVKRSEQYFPFDSAQHLQRRCFFSSPRRVDNPVGGQSEHSARPRRKSSAVHMQDALDFLLQPGPCHSRLSVTASDLCIHHFYHLDMPSRSDMRRHPRECRMLHRWPTEIMQSQVGCLRCPFQTCIH